MFFFQANITAAFVQDFQIWRSVKKQVIDLENSKNYSKAVNILDSFEKNFPNSNLLPLVYFEKAGIYLNHIGLLDKGFFFLEKAEVTKDKILSDKIQRLREQFADSITKIRLEKIQYYLLLYFVENISLPENLTDLSKAYNRLKKRDLLDGFGHFMCYELKPNSAIKSDFKLDFNLYSKGKDGEKNSKDDIFCEDTKDEGDVNISVLSIHCDKYIWKGEIKFIDAKEKTSRELVVKEGDFFDDYYVFSIQESGIIFLKNGMPVIVNLN